MGPIRVIVAEQRRDVFADVVAEALRRAGDFALLRHDVAPMAQIGAILDELAPPLDLLVVIGDRSQLSTDGLVEHHPRLIVSRVYISSEIVDFEMRTIGVNHLLSTLRCLARGSDASCLSGPEYAAVPGPGADETVLRLIPSPTSAHPLFKRILAYIDAAVLRYHGARPAADEDIPGYARSPQVIKDVLLQPDTSDQTTVDQAAARLFEALRGPSAESEPLALVHRRLALSEIEMKALLLCLAPELDAKYHPVIGILNDDMSRRGPTFALVCALLGDPLTIRRHLGRSGALTRWRLLSPDGSDPLADQMVQLDAALRSWILGADEALLADPALGGCVLAEPWRGAALLRRPADFSARDRLAEALVTGSGVPDWLLLPGDDASIWRALVEMAAGARAIDLLRVDLSRLAQLSEQQRAEATIRLARAAQLLQLTPVIDASDSASEPASAATVGALAAVFASLRKRCLLIAPDARTFVDVLPPGSASLLEEQNRATSTTATAFMVATSQAGLTLAPAECDRLGSAFPLSLASIDKAVHLAAIEGATAAPPDEHFARVAAAARRIASPDLPRFAQRVAPVFKLEDVVLPTEASAQLHELVSHVVHAAQVLNAWGFGAQMPYGRGIAALFHGASGTGKTMAAQAIAHTLRTEVFLVDLSRVVSKYIGESEKNLDVVFKDAERAGAVLVFDEADAIFAKRSEIKDAHDRYANIEVAYLLQRVESFTGLVILTTNFRQNVDQAFLRRLRFVVEFPKPDAQAREKIWRHCLPGQAPLAEDLDLRVLARRVELTGGNIRQITLRAAFAAMSDDAARGREAITMDHLIAATRAELLKVGNHTAVRALDEFDKHRVKTPAQAA